MLLHYDCISQAKKEIYKDFLTKEHLVDTQIKLSKLAYPDGTTDEEANFWGYILRKDGRDYLISAKDSKGKEINIKSILPVLPKAIQKVASGKDVYYLIKKPISAKFKPEQTMPFNEFITSLTPFKHSNPRHYLLMVFLALSSSFDRVNFRVCSPAGFGKDSAVDIFGNLLGKSGTIENPTVAKLEERANVLDWLAVNEVVEIAKAEWLRIEQFLLSAGSLKPEITKRSRATRGVGEIIDLTNFSITLMYNDIDCYTQPEKYFDFVSKEAIKDRFPPLRLYGTFVEDFNAVKSFNVKSYVKKNIHLYKELIYAYTYYKDHIPYHNYNTDTLCKVPERWKTSLTRLLRIIDGYCETQEEFDSWIVTINDSLKDYMDMLKYPKKLEEVSQRLSEKKYRELWKELKECDTFTEKLMLLGGSEQKVKDVKGFWK